MVHANHESGNLWTRRHWLKAAGALTVGATCTQTLQAAVEPDNAPVPLMQIGILMGTFARDVGGKIGCREGLWLGLRATEHGLRRPAHAAR